MKASGRAAAAMAAAAIALGSAACSTDRETRVPQATVAREIPDLVEGKTTRDDLVLRFGPPTAEFEAGRIFTWRLVAGRHGIAPALTGGGHDFAGGSSWRQARFSLVAVFDPHAVVRRFSLVAVR
jgi:hypothetical protein